MNGTIIETLRDNYTPSQVLQIRREEKKAGHWVNVNRLHSRLVEIQVIEPSRTIEARYSIKQLN